MGALPSHHLGGDYRISYAAPLLRKAWVMSVARDGVRVWICGLMMCDPPPGGRHRETDPPIVAESYDQSHCPSERCLRRKVKPI